MKYEIQHYGADGHTGPDADYVIDTAGTLAEARAIVRRALGVKRLSAARRWAGMGDTVEAYHDLPPSHPHAIGCGGVAIVQVRHD